MDHIIPHCVSAVKSYPLHDLPPYIDELVDITCFAFPMCVIVMPYLGSLRINEIDYFEKLEQIGGFDLAKFDLQRGIIINIKFNAVYSVCYLKSIKDLRRDNPILQVVVDPIIFSFPNEMDGDEPIADLSLVFDGRQVIIAGIVTPYYEDQECVRYCTTVTLGSALLLLELVYDFAGMATDNGYRTLNY